WGWSCGARAAASRRAWWLRSGTARPTPPTPAVPGPARTRRGASEDAQGCTSAYSRPVVTVIIIIGVGLAVGALLFWTLSIPPTRPRPDSRYRGRTYMSVHRRLERRARGARPEPPDRHDG